MKRIASILSSLLLLLTLAGVIFWWKTNFPGQIQDIFKGKNLAGTELSVNN